MFLPASAEVRSVEQARSLAYGFMESRVMTKASHINLQLVYDGGDILTRSSLSPACYVFNNESGPGFVIVSGDDAVSPILGFSDSFNFKATGMPSSLRWWFRHIGRQVDVARAAGLRGGSSTDVGTDVARYETALWDQTEPYNAQCPMDGSERSVTGCGPTAIAIAMRYREWPAAGTGVVPDYKVEVYDEDYNVVGYNSFPGRTLGVAYDWSSMPLTDGYFAAWSSKAKEQVARLMADIGAATKAKYSSEATGIYDDDVPPALSAYFGYDKSVDAVFRADWDTGEILYTASQWLALVKEEVASNGPTIFAGSDDQYGHMFVLDGYTTEDFFHVNWGWGGYSNGYYKIDALEPEDQGTGANDMGSYNEWQSVIVNFKKNASAVTPEPEPEPEKTLEERISLKYSRATRELTITGIGEMDVTYLISDSEGTRSVASWSSTIKSATQDIWNKTIYFQEDSGQKIHRFIFERGTETKTVEFIVGKEEQL